jgi:O-antigen ligase
VVLSVDPGTSARRLALASTTFVLAAMLPWLTTGMRQFTTFLIFTLGTVLALSFLGVLIVPELTIHQPTDLVEPEIAGDWRGVYVHKNITASLMAIFIYVGCFVARAERPRIGIAIAVAAFVFLFFTHGKSAFGLFFAAGLAAFAVDRARSLPLKFVIALGPLVLLNMITVGSATNDALHSAVAALPIDATFTGRTDIWRFAMEAIRDNFWTGRGFEAFWYTASLRSGDDNTMRWMGDVANSHNSYVDLALTIGVPGLALVIVAFVFLPLKDFHNTLAAQANREFARLFLVLWLFTLYCGTFEVFFLSRANPMWFVMALAVCGLRYTSRYEIRQ